MANRTIIQLDTISTADAATAGLAAIHFEVEIDGISSPLSRQLGADQIQALLLARTGRIRQYNARGKVGTTSGWVVGAANDKGLMATLPASQTGSTLVVPIPDLIVGQVITEFFLTGSQQSAGNANSITADLRRLTAATGGATDASVGAFTAPVSVTADTILSRSNAKKAGLTVTVGEGESYYLLLTSSTGSSCTQELQAVSLVVTES